jgi:hypothetical protein
VKTKRPISPFSLYHRYFLVCFPPWGLGPLPSVGVGNLAIGHRCRGAIFAPRIGNVKPTALKHNPHRIHHFTQGIVGFTFRTVGQRLISHTLPNVKFIITIVASISICWHLSLFPASILSGNGRFRFHLPSQRDRIFIVTPFSYLTTRRRVCYNPFVNFLLATNPIFTCEGEPNDD